MADRQVFPVLGMTCAACARRIERALSVVPGVRSAQVDQALDRASIEAPGVAPAVLAEAVSSAGYQLVTEPPAAGTHHVPQTEPAWPVAAGLLVTAPLLAPMLGLPLHLDWRLQGMLALVVVGGIGWRFLWRAAVLARRAETSMDTLVALGAIMGLTLGVIDGLQGYPHPSFEISASLVAFLRLGRWIEVKARHRATGGIRDLLTFAPSQAERLAPDGSTASIPVANLQPGDRVRVRPGGAVPVDGLVEEGTAEAEEALLTGEPLPIPKRSGDSVLAGSVVHGGSVIVRVTAAGEQTWLANLARQVSEATSMRPPAQILADRLSAIFVPSILVLSAATFLTWWWLGGDVMHATRVAITLLVVACPCALGLATPIAMAVALGTAARQGVLVRDQRALEALGGATDLVFDKTGTLTPGQPSIVEIRPLAALGADHILRIAAALERTSEHPLARALRDADDGQTVTNWRAIPAGGVEGVIDGTAYRLGSLSWTGVANEHVPAGSLAIALVSGDRPLGLLILADPLRPETPDVLRQAQALGVRLHLLSGDRPEVVERLTAGLPFTTRLGGLDPAAKAAYIRTLQANGGVVAFIGDGVNDATALATADAGISLPGLDATAVAAGLNLRRNGLQPVLDLHRLARRLRSIVRQNLAWAFGYNLVLVPLAAAGLLEAVGGPVTAGAAMALSSLTVVLNAVRLRRGFHLRLSGMTTVG